MDTVDGRPRSKKINKEETSSVDGPPPPSNGNRDPEPENPPEKQENVFNKSYSNLLKEIKKARRHKPLVNFENIDRNKVTTVHTTYFPEEPIRSSANQKVIEADTNRFKMHYPKGVFTLINMKDFHSKASRDWSDRDALKLVDLFLDLGFIVQRFDNPSSKEIDLITEAAAESDFNCGKCQLENKYCGASVCAVLSCGDNQKFSCKDGDKKIQELVRKFRKTNLSDKPKIFIFQTSKERDSKETEESRDAIDGPSGGKEEYRMTLPAEADFLYIYSTTPGQVSWRSEKRNGSWFIHHLDKVFRGEAGKLDVLRMLLKVNRSVKADWEEFVSTTTYKDEKQVPSFVSQLRKDLYLDLITTTDTSREE